MKNSVLSPPRAIKHWPQDRGLRSTENKLTKPSVWTRLQVKMENWSAVRSQWVFTWASFFFGNQVTLSIKHSNKVPEGEEIRWRLVCVCVSGKVVLRKRRSVQWTEVEKEGKMWRCYRIISAVCECNVYIEYTDDLLHTVCKNVQCATALWHTVSHNAMQCTWPEL